MDNKKRNELILNSACEFLEKMNVGIKDAFVEDMESETQVASRKLQVESGKSNEEEQVLVGIEVENPAILIGFKGRTLAPLQFLMSLVIKEKLERWVRVVLDINGYRGEQKTRLEEKTKEAIEKAKTNGEEVRMEPMSSYERRICHMTAAGVKGVTSESDGEGYDRHVVIKVEAKKTKKVKKK